MGRSYMRWGNKWTNRKPRLKSPKWMTLEMLVLAIWNQLSSSIKCFIHTPNSRPTIGFVMRILNSTSDCWDWDATSLRPVLSKVTGLLLILEYLKRKACIVQQQDFLKNQSPPLEYRYSYCTDNQCDMVKRLVSLCSNHGLTLRWDPWGCTKWS
jgi:hypothetical protein